MFAVHCYSFCRSGAGLDIYDTTGHTRDDVTYIYGSVTLEPVS